MKYLNFATIENGRIANIIVATKEFADQQNAIFIGDLPVNIGTRFENRKFVIILQEFNEDGNVIEEREEFISPPAFPPEITPSEQRRISYETMNYKEDGMLLLPWHDEALTVDEANKLWIRYTAREEFNTAHEITVLIQAAVSYIRALYPD